MGLWTQQWSYIFHILFFISMHLHKEPILSTCTNINIYINLYHTEHRLLWNYVYYSQVSPPSFYVVSTCFYRWMEPLSMNFSQLHQTYSLVPSIQSLKTSYHKISNIRRTKSENLSYCRLVLQLPLSCLWPIHWSQVLSWEWRCSWSSADRWCSNYIWVINNFITY